LIIIGVEKLTGRNLTSIVKRAVKIADKSRRNSSFFRFSPLSCDFGWWKFEKNRYFSTGY